MIARVSDVRNVERLTARFLTKMSPLPVAPEPSSKSTALRPCLALEILNITALRLGGPIFGLNAPSMNASSLVHSPRR